MGVDSSTQDFMQEVVLSIATQVGLEVTIVDENLVRVAGSGAYQSSVAEQLPTSCSFGDILHSRTPSFVTEPRQDAKCLWCQKRHLCQESGHLALPLIVQDRPVGVIALVAFGDQQRQELLKRQDELLRFLRHMARLVSLAWQNDISTQELRQAKDWLAGIVDAVEEGILAIDAEERIICCNHAASTILRFSREVVGETLSSLVPQAPLLDVIKTKQGYTNREVIIGKRHSAFSVMSSAAPLFSGEALVGAVAMIRSSESVHRIAYDLSERQPDLAIERIMGHHPSLQEAKRTALMAAAGHAAVLLLGESGTGKELFARAIHHHSPRSGGPFVAVNCAALPEDLLESELFGYEEGAFTGARRGGKPGKFELAAGGTLFLDEVSDCSLQLQAKLLRALDTGELQRVGSTRTVRSDVRVVSATNRDPEALVRHGEFREDLFYRLSVIPITIPPLRSRTGDIPLLADAFIHQHSEKMGRQSPQVSGEFMERLSSHPWPGNVRELENVIQYALHMGSGPLLGVEHLPPRLKSSQTPAPSPLSRALSSKEWETEAIKRGLQELGHTPGAKALIAKRLGISRSTVYRRIKEYGLG